jgi:hypothetical protein
MKERRAFAGTGFCEQPAVAFDHLRAAIGLDDCIQSRSMTTLGNHPRVARDGVAGVSAAYSVQKCTDCGTRSAVLRVRTASRKAKALFAMNRAFLIFKDAPGGG